MKKILIVEDDFSIRQSVEFALRRAGYNVQSLSEGAGALDAIKLFAPDLIVLDVMLPGLDGITITEQLRKQDTDTAIVIVSALDQDSDKIAGLTIGADDYLSKPFSIKELLARVEANLRRVNPNRQAQKVVIELGDVIVDPLSRTVTVAGSLVDLRAKEFDLLYTLFSSEGTVYTRELLAEEVWGYKHLASSRTIDVHTRRIRLLIEEPSAFTYIKTIHGIGYRVVVEKKE